MQMVIFLLMNFVKDILMDWRHSSKSASATSLYILLVITSPLAEALPLGAGVTINTSNGVITGTAPPAGTYVVTVCVKEWRNGELIATQRKDLAGKSG